MYSPSGSGSITANGIDCASNTSTVWFVTTDVNKRLQIDFSYGLSSYPGNRLRIYQADPSGGGCYAAIYSTPIVDTGRGDDIRGSVVTDFSTGCFVVRYDVAFVPRDWTKRLSISFSAGEIFESNLIVNGNVGIGVANPTNRLEVNGTVRAKKIIVEPEDWADFVFANDYELPSLSEVESHIEAQGHLPGIPSAAEATTNGVNLAEINAKLLQKIEELTLYVIEQNNRLKVQSEEINSLKGRIGNLQQIE